jgi:hypothetical protein
LTDNNFDEQVIRMLLKGQASDKGQLDSVPAWLLAQMRIAAEPLNSTLLDTVLLCARVAARHEGFIDLPLIELSQLQELVKDGMPLLGRGSAAAPLAAAYVLTVVATARMQEHTQVCKLSHRLLEASHKDSAIS